MALLAFTKTDYLIQLHGYVVVPTLLITQFYGYKCPTPTIMKKYLCILVLGAACGNSATTPEDQKTNLNSESKPVTANSLALDCAKMKMFKKGAIIEAKSYEADGTVTNTQQTTIQDVKEEGGMTVAYVQATDTDLESNKPFTVNYLYKCDGKTVYMDIGSLFRGMEEGASVAATYVEYPIAITENQALPSLTNVITIDRNGKKVTMNYTYENRKVGAKTSLTTPAGTWDAYPVSADIKVEMDIPGMDENAKKMMQAMQEKNKASTTTWFVPSVGIVKMEFYQGGKLLSSNQITSIK